jgi:hypothetical protein
MTETSDTTLRIRVYIDGALAREDWVDVADGPYSAWELGSEHVAFVEAAQEAGKPWMCEVYDPAVERLDPEACCMRFGTDAAMMQEPLPIIGWDGGPVMVPRPSPN